MVLSAARFLPSATIVTRGTILVAGLVGSGRRELNATRHRMARDDMLIVGAGPSGLFAAAELARHGVQARLIERDVQLHHQARATSIKPGTLEILESAGLASPFLKTAVHIRSVRMYGPDLSELRATSYAGLDCRYEFECSLPQYETQRILEDQFASLGGAVERGVTATRVEPDADGDVVVELVHADGGVETVRPDVVIGADGAHSVLRHSLVEELEGITYQGTFLVADIAMQAPFPRDQASFVYGPEGLLLLAPLPKGRWLTSHDLDEGLETLTAEDVADRTEVRLGGRCRPGDVAWFSPFRMHRRIVSRLTDGRRFLIGDAAHLSSPFAGEGQNSGIQDAYDLAWKLALVARGHASAALLDGYAAERRIADRHCLSVSDHAHHAIISIADTVRQGRQAPAAVADPLDAALLRDARAMVDIDYAGSPLIADDGATDTTVQPHPGQRYPDWTQFAATRHHLLVFGPVADAASLERLDRRWSGLLHVSHDPNVDPARAGVPDGGAVLIRPDGHIGFRSPAVDTDALTALDRHLSSYLIAPSPGPNRSAVHPTMP